MPKAFGGIGFQLPREMNEAFVAKVGWQIYKDLDKPWIKLIKSKYLRGWKIWDLQSCDKDCSWF